MIDNFKHKIVYGDNGMESSVNEETGEMGSLYLTFFDLFSYLKKDAKNTLLIGGGAYIPNALFRKI